MNTTRFGLLLLLAGCDYSGDFLFPLAGEIDDVVVLTGPDGGPVVPAVIESQEDILANIIYSEVGPSLTTNYGGITVNFVGTGNDVCIWVDPEAVFWNQAVSGRPSEESLKWTYPDNFFDDGDLDMFAGLSVYYTGSPGEVMGDFKVAYEDSLGNTVPISLASCPNLQGIQDLAAAGRGSPEYCTISATDVGISYTIAMRTFSTPLDDDRLSYGFLIADGPCDSTNPNQQGLRQIAASGSALTDECVIQGESIVPAGEDVGPFYGFDELNNAGRIWPRSIDFEAAYCDPEQRMQRFCQDEAALLEENGETCSWRDAPNENNRCYCGNLDDTPEGGAI